ncbi:MAG: hypothetical protein ABSE69_20710 [Roseiarcus sp.]
MNDPGLLVVRSEPIDLEMEAEYHRWYADHLRQLAAVPGVTRAQRFESVDGTPRFMALYETESLDVFNSADYLKVGRFGSLTKHVRFTRNVYRYMPPEGPLWRR